MFIPQRYMYFPTKVNDEIIYQTIDMSTVTKAVSSEKCITLVTYEEIIHCHYRSTLFTFLIYEKVVRLMNKWSKANG